MTRRRPPRPRAMRSLVPRMLRRAWIALVLLLLAAAAAAGPPATIRAQEGADPAADGVDAGAGPELGGVSGFDAGDWLGLGLRLAIVLVVIWVAVIAMRWYVRRSTGTPGGGPSRNVEVLETRALGPNRALHLVRVGDRAVLVGATAERISPLVAIEDPEEVAALAPPGQTAPGGGLRALVGGLGGVLATASTAGAVGVAETRRRWAPALHARLRALRARGAPVATPAGARARGETSPAGVPPGMPLVHGQGGVVGVRLGDIAPAAAPRRTPGAPSAGPEDRP